MVVPIALRADERAVLHIPADLTVAEAEKLSRVVMAYADRDGIFSAPKPSWEAYAASVTEHLT